MPHEKPDFTVSAESRLLEQMLDKLEVGEVATYENLSAEISADVRTTAYSALGSARKRLLRDRSKVYDTVRNVGLMRLSDQAIVKAADRSVLRMRRGARRAQLQLACVKDFDAMDPADQTRHNLGLTVFGAVAALTDGRRMKQIAAKVAESRRVLTLGQTLEVFTK